MNRCLTLFAVILAFSVVLRAADACAKSSEAGRRDKFVDPSREISFLPPAEGWKVKAGFGEEVASLAGQGRGAMRIKWEKAPSPAHAPLTPEQAVMNEFPGSHMLSSHVLDLNDNSAAAARFESADGLDGIVILIHRDDGIVSVSCVDDARAFLSTFLACRDLASSITSEPASADPSTLAAAVNSVEERARFAWLDGRAGCPGIADEPRRMAQIAAAAGDAASARELSMLSTALKGKGSPRDSGQGSFGAVLKARAFASEGHRESAAEILRKLAASDDGFFAALDLARISLEDGNAEEAGRILLRAGSGRYGDASASRLLTALRIWQARLDGDAAAAKTAFESVRSDLCGTSGAIAAYELGRALSRQDPARAAGLFEQAIEADRSHAPAYLSLGRALLDSGASAAEVKTWLERLLSRAPDSPEIAGLRRRFTNMDGPRRDVSRVSGS